MAYLIDADWLIDALARRRGALATIAALAPRGIDLKQKPGIIVFSWMHELEDATS